jgi:site-specific recombinase XerD
MTDKKLPYKEATLNDRGGKLTSRWYIQFWVWSDIENKMIRRWDYAINRENGKDEADTIRIRRAYAKARIRAINQLLEEGYHVKEKIEEKSIDMTVRQAMDYALKISGLKGGSYNSYSSTMNIFLEWAKTNQLDTINLDRFKRKDAYQYIDWRISCGIAGVTINNDVSYIRRLWSILKKREIIQVNPFSELEKQKEERSFRNLAYTDSEIELLKTEISAADPELWSFVQMIYNTFARPNEIRQLKVSDIRLSDRLIYIDASISKNNKSEFVTIPDSLLDTIIDLIKFKSSGDWLFPGIKTCISKNRMNSRHSEILSKHNFSEDHTLYSWKHTGVVRAFKAGVDLKRIQLQCRHGSILQTDIYLKSMGLYENLEIKLKMPPL